MTAATGTFVLQVDEVDEEVSWGEEVQETSNSSQRMPLRESR